MFLKWNLNSSLGRYTKEQCKKTVQWEYNGKLEHLMLHHTTICKMHTTQDYQYGTGIHVPGDYALYLAN